CSAFPDPSIGAIHTCPCRTNATRSPEGAITGSSPSDNSRGSPPSNGTLHSCTLVPPGRDAGFRGVLEFGPPWSPPLTYTTQRPSAESLTLVISSPRSSS